MGDLVVIRGLFVALMGTAAYFLKPFSLDGPAAAVVGVVCALAVVAFEFRIREVSLKRLIGAAFGSVLGIFGAFLCSLVLKNAMGDNATTAFIQVLLLGFMAYCGLVVGAAKGEMLNLAAFGGVFGSETQTTNSFKILDTSVIIDGRIADIAETGFIDRAVSAVMSFGAGLPGISAVVMMMSTSSA